MSEDKPEVQQNNNSTKSKVVGMSVQQYYQGPLPPPEILRKFDEIVPGSAERIIKMAEGQFHHRVEMESKVIEADIQSSRQGRILGFIISITGLLVALLASLFGNQWAASIIGGGTIVSLVSVFMYGSRTRSNERKAKDVDK